MKKLFTITEAATMISVHPETLRRWDREGKFVAIKINDRGDRRYRESDILELMSTHKATILHAKSVKIDGYKVRWGGKEGFKTISGNFHLIGKPYAVKGKEFIGFAFFVDFFEKAKSGIDEEKLDRLVMEKVRDYIKSGKVFDGDMVTFEFHNNSFFEVQNPGWWEEKYSKPLVPELRVKAVAVSPTSLKNEAWRVILNFMSKSGDFWVTNCFGKNHEHVEYHVWIDSKELLKRDLSNTPKGAEILAVEYGIKRFNQTKDENGDRDITRITENHSARFGGKWVKDSLLPHPTNQFCQ